MNNIISGLLIGLALGALVGMTIKLVYPRVGTDDQLPEQLEKIMKTCTGQSTLTVKISNWDRSVAYQCRWSETNGD